jgi:hypothetical protein
MQRCGAAATAVRALCVRPSVCCGTRGSSDDWSRRQQQAAANASLGEAHETADVRWGRGDGGLDWKTRDLSDRRDRAMEYLFDVAKRRPIHDGLRAQAALNERRLRMPVEAAEDVQDATATAVLMDSLRSAMDRDDADGAELSTSEIDAARASNALLHDTARELGAMDEGLLADSVAHLSPDDVAMLAEELYGDASVSADARRAKLLREWFRLRRGGGAHLGYGSLQREERTAWHPWYLKDLGPKA